jgi:hypothetical protein
MRFKNLEIYIKTPKISVPFGLSIFTTENNENYYYYVLSFTDIDIDPNIEKFYLFLQKIEAFCQQTVKNNLAKWGCEYAFENLSFKSGFKETLFRLKINHTGKKPTEIYNERGELQNLDDLESLITEQCQAISLIEPNNLWINSNEYGITWKVHQMRVYPSNRPIGGVSLLDENIAIHNVKIIEKERIIEKEPDPNENQPRARRPAPPMIHRSLSSQPYKAKIMAGDEREPTSSKIPRGGVAMLPFLSMINSGGFQLKKVDHSEVNDRSEFNKERPGSPNDNLPRISLAEILKIRNNLKKNPDHQ